MKCPVFLQIHTASGIELIYICQQIKSMHQQYLVAMEVQDAGRESNQKLRVKLDVELRSYR